jgi:hypothetical protein
MTGFRQIAAVLAVGIVGIGGIGGSVLVQSSAGAAPPAATKKDPSQAGAQAPQKPDQKPEQKPPAKPRTCNSGPWSSQPPRLSSSVDAAATMTVIGAKELAVAPTNNYARSAGGRSPA